MIAAVWLNCFYVKAGFLCDLSNANFVWAVLIKLFSSNLMRFFNKENPKSKLIAREKNHLKL